MAMQKGGMLTVYFSEKDTDVLKKLEGVCKEKGIKKNRVVTDAIKTYMDVYDSTHARKKK